jgi:hypothetical protein
MVSWITEVLGQTTLVSRHPFVATLLLSGVLLTSCAISLAVLIRLSPDYFAAPRAKPSECGPRNAFLGRRCPQKYARCSARCSRRDSFAARNAGSGTVDYSCRRLAVGLPGKRSLLLQMLRWPLLLRSVNRLRLKFSRPPLVIG